MIDERELRDVLQRAIALVLVEQHATAHAVLERQSPPARKVGIYDLNIRVARGSVVLLGEDLPHAAISELIVDRFDLHKG